jgi:2-polyprenyl-3-methyl-5-hydroxy-6-metoxy-1,4-benzoquinol methylase
MKIARTFVQLSTRSWQGTPDHSVAQLADGRPFFSLTLEVARAIGAPVALLTPSWDKGDSTLARAYRDVFGSDLVQTAGWDASPLDRLVAACVDLSDTDYVLRLNGLNAYASAIELGSLAQDACSASSDAALFDDDIPPQMTGDVLRVGAVRRAAVELPTNSPLRVHARQAIPALAGARVLRAASPIPNDDRLRAARVQNEALYRLAHLEYDEKRVIHVGDQLGFHYDLAIDRLRGRERRVLDIACGVGFGAHRLSQEGHTVVGADIDTSVLSVARERFAHVSGLSFEEVDGEEMPYETASFDVVATFETLEHVRSPERYLAEVRRVLRPGGELFLSVPQNRWGHIPLNPQHEREYTVPALTELLRLHFANVDVQGIKQGRIIVPGDPVGSNCYAFCS